MQRGEGNLSMQTFLSPPVSCIGIELRKSFLMQHRSTDVASHYSAMWESREKAILRRLQRYRVVCISSGAGLSSFVLSLIQDFHDGEKHFQKSLRSEVRSQTWSLISSAWCWQDIFSLASHTRKATNIQIKTECVAFVNENGGKSSRFQFMRKLSRCASSTHRKFWWMCS